MQLARTPGLYRGVLLVVLLAGLVQAGPPAPGQDQGEKTAEKTFTVAELDQAVAPIALYPDSLVSQILMAATYPLEIVQASRWVQANPKLKGDALTKELEKQKWDPSVKSLVNFPDVLKMMSDKLDWTQQLGDAMLSQQKDVMAAVQRLRTKAIEAGNLKTTEQQKVIVEEKIIVIQAASPQVVYVPVYNPVVVYGAWPYPAYPPYYYRPPGYASSAAVGFVAGVAVGAAWGYAWGHCGWRGGSVDIDINRNLKVNHNINRKNHGDRMGNGGRSGWKHNPQHRQGVRYRNSATAREYGRGGRTPDARNRGNQYRGRSTGATASNRAGASNRARSHQRSSRSGAFGHSGSRESVNRASSRGRSSRGGGGRSHGGGGGRR